MATYYLDVDDEITSAATRIRSSADTRVALVLPPGSRVATSRMNFRLLAREAQERNRRLSIVVPDAAVRALAASAGLPVFATVGEYEAAELEATRPARTAGETNGGRGEVAAALDELGATMAPAAPAAPAATPAPRERHDEPRSRREAATTVRPRSAGATAPETNPAPKRRRRPGVATGLLLGLLVLVLVVAGAGAYLILPSATIALTPHDGPVGPLNLTVRVDPTIGTPQPDRAAIPGVMQQFVEQASGTYQATGKKVVETAATGSVTLTNCDNSAGHVIPAGTIVRTSSGISFKTAGDVPLARASTTPPPNPSITCTTGNTNVTATTKGPAGNVGVGTINRLVGSFDPSILFVTNNTATTGGSHKELSVVQQSDIDAAKQALQTQLTQKFQTDLANPPSLPAGVTLFPETGQVGPSSFSPDDAKVLGTQVPTFELVASATGTALAADLSPAKTIGEDRIRSAVAEGFVLDEASVVVTVGDPAWDGMNVTVPVNASAMSTRQLDRAALVKAVKGKSAAETKAYLGQYGDVRVDLWPGWASTIPTLDFRIDFTIETPSRPKPTPSVSPSGTAPSSGAPSSSPSGSGAASPSASPSVAAPSASASQ